MNEGAFLAGAGGAAFFAGAGGAAFDGLGAGAGALLNRGAKVVAGRAVVVTGWFPVKFFCSV